MFKKMIGKLVGNSILITAILLINNTEPTDTQPFQRSEDSNDLDARELSIIYDNFNSLYQTIKNIIAPAIYSIYNREQNISWHISKKMESMREDITKSTTSLKLLQLIDRYFKKYSVHLQDLKQYKLKIGVMESSINLSQREHIFSELEDYLDQAIYEAEEILIDKSMQYYIDNGHNKKLIPSVTEGGDLGNMEGADIYFVHHLGYTVRETIKRLTEFRNIEKDTSV